jgi:hypothetical protein
MNAIVALARTYAAQALREAALVHPGALPKGLKLRIELIEAGEFDDASEVRAVILALQAVESALGGGLPSPLNGVRHD